MKKPDSIEIRDLSLAYQGKEVLANLNSHIPIGKMTFLIGPNGSGKSSLLKILAGILPYSGAVCIPSRSTQEPYQIGYVPQRLDMDISLPLTVTEFMAMSLIACHHSPKQRRESIEFALSTTGTMSLRDSHLGTLSGGQLQRVLLARAIIHKPTLLLLDEPEAGIDKQGESEMFSLIQTLNQSQSMTAVIVSHNLKQVSQYADYVILFGHIGQGIIAEGAASEVVPQYGL